MAQTEPARQMGDIDRRYKREELARITSDPRICSGKLTIKGTRLMVITILGRISAGYEVADILKEYPGMIEEADVRQCLRWGAWETSYQRIDRESGCE